MPSSGPSSPDDSSRRLQRFAASLRDLSAVRDIDEMLQLSVDLAVEIIDGVDLADVMLLRDGEVTVPVSSAPLAAEVDRAQQEAGEGPCLTVLRDAELDRVVVQDLEQDDQWPKFGDAALSLGVRSVVAYRLFRIHDGPIGALNLFGFEPERTDLALELGQVLATQCSLILDAEIERQGLEVALQSRDVIGQAKGILMERHRITATEAFTLLRDASGRHNIKIRELAENVTRTGALPD